MHTCMKKLILLIAGFIALIIGSLGVFLPILPTTPFILLSAGCFSVSSPRFSAYLKNSKYFGSYIENYQEKTGVPRKIKVRSILLLWAGLILSMILVGTPQVIVLLSVVGIGVSIHLITLKTRD